MKILLIGANGQLGNDLVMALTAHDLVSLTHADVEVADPQSVRAVLEQHRPDLVMNMAAYHKVDEVEANPEKAFIVNALGARNLALACQEFGAALLHMSTDYVFAGDKGNPYVEDDLPGPINVYGITKLAGEHFIRCLLNRHYIVRSSGLYGVAGSSGKGGNFVELMLHLAGEGRDIKVVDDQVLTPTYTLDLAHKISELITTSRYGTYHITNSGACSWYQFAQGIFELSGLSPQLEPTTTTAFGARARRPSYSVLAHQALLAIGLSDMRPWREALAAYLDERERR